MGLLVLSTGLGLLSLGLLIVAFPRIFAYVVAAVLIGAGLVIIGLAIRILWMGHRTAAADQSEGNRYKVRVRVID